MVDILYHYYEAEQGPFRSISRLSNQQYRDVMQRIKQDEALFASRRSDDYLDVRRELEQKARELFIIKGGKPLQHSPQYMTLGPCEWIKSWYRNGVQLSIPLDALDPSQVSFTYGDLFPTMRYEDGKPYRKTVFTKNEIFDVIAKFGLPQHWNGDGSCGPERYIEVQVWDDALLERHIPSPGSRTDETAEGRP
ncbi:hypothetical protein SK3146_00994 [Paenibacillus konkukensis]|uniref:Uncharacterized protein n=1 Tax=Paenibacillus konkukensis TaxID=2020716 RepID=A0ABY4RJV7_9BACL|nr:hypothetical protein [Paenibacillus konkukensis]UQZ81838.1 hypothetical protein SK3146_00994 [Paenibacillus konkukensis]